MTSTDKAHVLRHRNMVRLCFVQSLFFIFILYFFPYIRQLGNAMVVVRKGTLYHNCKVFFVSARRVRQ